MKKTVLNQLHKNVGAKMAPFGSFEMPINYTKIIEERDWTRNECSIFDTSHMGELFFKGDIIDSGLNSATSVDIANLKNGKCKYGFLLNDKGGVIDDLIVYKISDENVMIVVNSETSLNDYNIIKSRLSSGSFINKTDDLSKIDVQGPKSRDILQKVFDIDLSNMKYFTFDYYNILDEKLIVSRTGYTGELGFEIYATNNTIKKIWEILLSTDGVKPAGLGARDMLRLEMGYSLYGNDLSEDITPVEADLDLFINKNHSFVGSDKLVQQRENGVEKQKISFKTNSKRTPRHGFFVLQDDDVVGEVTSGIFSPELGYSIGFGFVEVSKFNFDKDIVLSDNKRVKIDGKLCNIPFIKKTSLRD